MEPCIFCHILAGMAPASIIYQDELCTAFLDIQPVNSGHVLVVPNIHAAYLAELPETTGERMFRVAQRCAAALRASGLRCEGVNLFLADGEAAMQEVFHVHLHIFPRYHSDGFGLNFGPDYTHLPSRMDLDAVATQIRATLKIDP